MLGFFPKFPAGEEAGGEILGDGFGPGFDLFLGEPLPVFDFDAGETDWSAGESGVEADVFPSGIGMRAEGSDFFDFVVDEAEFFGEFSVGAGLVVFTRIDVARGAGVPKSGAFVFEARSFLEENFLLLVEDKKVDGAVSEVVAVDDIAALGADDAIVFIDDIESFGVALSFVLMEEGIDGAGEVDPIEEGEFFGPGGEGKLEFGGEGGPGDLGREVFLELFSALGEPAANEFVEKATVVDGEVIGPGFEGHHGGVDGRAGVEALGGDDLDRLGGPFGLDAQGEDAEVLASGRGEDAINHFFLEHEDGAAKGGGAFEEVAEDGAASGVGEIAEKLDRAVSKEGADIEADGIGIDDFDGGIVLKFLAEVIGEASVELDQDDAFGFSDEVFGEGTGSGADFDDRFVGGNFELIHDPCGGILVDQEILPQFFGGDHALIVEDFFDFACGHVSLSIAVWGNVD